MTTKKTTAKPRTRRVFDAQTKCEAVLSLWSERRKPTEICRELSIKWATLNHWQSRALEAMLEILAPRSPKDEQRGPALGPRLEKMLSRASQKTQKISKLEKRLEKIQEGQKNPS